MEQTSDPDRWRVVIRLVDIYGQPAAGVQATIVLLPPTASVAVEQPLPTDINGYATGYVSSAEQVCVTVEVHVGSVVLREKPVVCFQ